MSVGMLCAAFAALLSAVNGLQPDSTFQGTLGLCQKQAYCDARRMLAHVSLKLEYKL